MYTSFRLHNLVGGLLLHREEADSLGFSLSECNPHSPADSADSSWVYSGPEIKRLAEKKNKHRKQNTNPTLLNEDFGVALANDRLQILFSKHLSPFHFLLTTSASWGDSEEAQTHPLGFPSLLNSRDQHSEFLHCARRSLSVCEDSRKLLNSPHLFFPPVSFCFISTL